MMVIMNRRWVGTAHLVHPGRLTGEFVVACGLDISSVAHTDNIDEVTCSNCKRSVLYKRLRREHPEPPPPAWTQGPWTWSADGD